MLVQCPIFKVGTLIYFIQSWHNHCCDY